MSKSVKGMEDIPSNAVEVRVSTRTIEENGSNLSWMHISFNGVVVDPVVLMALQDALASGGPCSTPFDEKFESFTLDNDKTNIRNNWTRPRFWVQEPLIGGKQVVMSFECWGTPMVAETIAEMFEIYLHSIEGVYVTTRGDGTVYLDRVNDAIEDEWLSRGY